MKKIIIILLAVVVFQKWDVINGYISPNQPGIAAEDAEVILYATSWCGYCQKARELFEEYDIEYYEYDVEKSAEGREQRKQFGGNGVPVVVINGSVIKGYNRNKILSLLGEA